ncbi:DUF488 domain-containing protein [Pseudomonas stutzeri]|uniref:DUF488 domain-containing protein n=1 Tax=Stutzerimonas stutzeri TaxID=316 RepID=A0A2N8S2N4_STUST|nr:DUF488 domain-containing protein [Stutzerimonas stutzeri]MCQ4296453.1 DUF488 domain-containing protein [Stutzerimonas stutzeri]PNF80889.1 hypothetical protein CXK92_11820 [Stutzerimonas stutzeri]
MAKPATVWTIGHSTRSLEQFVEVLRHHQIEAIADVRRFPGSRRLPQFGESALREALLEHGIEYRWIEELGGRRRPLKDSPNLAWRNSSFRGYADHLQSAEFDRGLNCLLEMAAQRRTAMMCAEVLWWRCHRSLVSDVLKTSGIGVLHIQDDKPAAAHPFTAPARLVDGQLSYAAGEGESLRKEVGSGQINLDL